MNSIATNVDGVRINEKLANTAKVMDKITICRSMTHGEAAHERGTHNMFTGYRPSPALDFPSMGSVVTHEFGPRNNLPQYVCIPNQPNKFAGTGYLSSSFAPFSLGSDPASGNFTVRDLKLPGGVDDTRFARRRRVLDAVTDHFVSKEKADSLDAVDSFYQRAYAMVSSEKAREAFNINAEPAKLRDEYGRNTAGARMLLARRLVESGVRFVTLTYGGWDMHNNIQGSISSQLPPFDQAFASLIRDLDQRGILKETLGLRGVRIRPDSQDQRHGRPRPLAQSLQRGAGGRRGQRRLCLRDVRYHGQRTGKQRPHRGRLGDNHLPLHGHCGRQRVDGPRRSPDRNRRRRQSSQRLAGVITRRAEPRQRPGACQQTSIAEVLSCNDLRDPGPYGPRLAGDLEAGDEIS